MTGLVDRLASALGDRYRLEIRWTEPPPSSGRGHGLRLLAEDTRHDRWVAIKVLARAAATIGAERFSGNPHRGAIASSAHPRLIDSGEADELLYYVMPYVSGESSAERSSARAR
jgi:serine/threonine-protein kinase